MAFNGVGVFQRLYSWVTDAANGIKIRADRMDNEMNGFASGLSNCVTRDGQGKFGVDVDANGFSLKNLAPGSAAAPSIYDNVSSSRGVYFPSATEVGVSTGGVNRVTIGSTSTTVNGRLAVSNTTTDNVLEVTQSNNNTAVTIIGRPSDQQSTLRFMNNAGTGGLATIRSDGGGQLSFDTVGGNAGYFLGNKNFVVGGVYPADLGAQYKFQCVGNSYFNGPMIIEHASASDSLIVRQTNAATAITVRGRPSDSQGVIRFVDQSFATQLSSITSNPAGALSFNNVSGAVLSIGSNGAVSNPSSTQPAFAGRNGTSIGAGNPGAAINFAVVDINQVGYWNNAGSTFTAPNSGLYELNLELLVSVSGGTNLDVTANILRNGASVYTRSFSDFGTASGSIQSVGIHYLVAVTAGQTLSFLVSTGPTSSASAISGFIYFRG